MFNNTGEMTELVCQLCGEEYTKEERIPKMISCGHSFCLVCFNDFIKFIQCCPTCNTEVTGPFGDLPTNYALLKVPNKTPENTTSRKAKLLAQLDEQKQQVQKVQDVVRKLDTVVDSSKDRVLSITDKKHHDDYEEEYELDMNFKSMEERLWKLDLALYCCYNPRIKPNFVLGSYSTKENFLKDIATELHKRKSIFVFKSEWYNIEVRWGRLNFKDGRLLIHSFTRQAPSYPSLFVPFRDLQKCMSTENFGTFMYINEEHFICTMTASSTKTLEFVQLCSGEDGPTFKGAVAEKIIQPEGPEIIKLEISKPKVIENDYEFLLSLPSDIKESVGEKFQIRMCEGRCKIVKNPGSFPNSESESEVAVATVISETLSNDITEKKVVKSVKDCGLFIHIARNCQNA